MIQNLKIEKLQLHNSISDFLAKLYHVFIYTFHTYSYTRYACDKQAFSNRNIDFFSS